MKNNSVNLNFSYNPLSDSLPAVTAFINKLMIEGWEYECMHEVGANSKCEVNLVRVYFKRNVSDKLKNIKQPNDRIVEQILNKKKEKQILSHEEIGDIWQEACLSQEFVFIEWYRNHIAPQTNDPKINNTHL